MKNALVILSLLLFFGCVRTKQWRLLRSHATKNGKQHVDWIYQQNLEKGLSEHQAFDSTRIFLYKNWRAELEQRYYRRLKEQKYGKRN